MGCSALKILSFHSGLYGAFGIPNTTPFEMSAHKNIVPGRGACENYGQSIAATLLSCERSDWIGIQSNSIACVFPDKSISVIRS